MTRTKKKASKISLEWKRGQRCDTAVSKRMRYVSKCGKFSVVYSHIVFGNNGDKKSRLSDRYYAERKDCDTWKQISIHQKRTAAEAACVSAANGNR